MWVCLSFSPLIFFSNSFNKKLDLIEKSVFDYKFKTKNVREYKEKIREEILESVIYV